MNGEHFAVMAGAGFDARMIKEADRGMKSRIGRAAYIYAGARNLSARRVKAAIEVDGRRFFTGRVSCVLVGNVGKVLGGVEAFSGARPDDGRLELGVVTARNPVEWTRTLGRLALGHPEKSPFVEVTRGTKFRIRFDRGFPYELDGGARPAARKLRIKARPSSITICVPRRWTAPASPRSLSTAPASPEGSLRLPRCLDRYGSRAFFFFFFFFFFLLLFFFFFFFFYICLDRRGSGSRRASRPAGHAKAGSAPRHRPARRGSGDGRRARRLAPAAAGSWGPPGRGRLSWA